MRPVWYRCPACGHAGEIITLHHIRSVHGIATREEFERTYGQPIEMDICVPDHVRVWAREMSCGYMSRRKRVKEVSACTT